MKIEVRVYDQCKYNPESKLVNRTEYSNFESLEIKEIPEEEIYKMGFDETDEYNEYCIIHLASGETATFKNSHIDVFEAR